MEQYSPPHDLVPSHSCFIIEILMDIMYTDIVLHDHCSRRVGDALIAEYDSTLRKQLYSGKLPDGLQKAVEIYCTRHYVSCSPELVLTAPSVAEELLQLARSLQEMHDGTPARPSTMSSSGKKAIDVLEPMQRIGKSILEDVAQLRKTMGIEHYDHLIDALGEAILESILKAAAECECEDMDNVTPGQTDSDPIVEKHGKASPFTQSIQRFASAVVERRRALKRLSEVELHNTADALLFPEPEKTTHAPPGDGGACSTPRQSPRKRPTDANEEERPRRCASTPSKTHAGDVKEGVIGEVVADGDAAAAWIHSPNVLARTYFLCVETNRYEPIVARGLFES